MLERGKRSETVVSFNKPASHFCESIPLGNGRLGAMIFGGIAKETVILNESSMWSGSDGFSYDRDIGKVMPQIRKLLLEGKYKQAERLYEKEILSIEPKFGGGFATENPFGTYQVLGTMNIHTFQYITGAQSCSEYVDYRRELDIENAVMSMEFGMHYYAESELTHYTRQCITSASDEAIVFRFTTDKPGRINFNASLDRPERFLVTPVCNDSLLMTGQLNDGKGGCGIKYACMLKAVAKGGSVKTDGTVLTVKNADEVLLFITAATDLKTFSGRNCKDALAASASDMERASAKGWDELLKSHIADYRKYFDRVEFGLGQVKEAVSRLSTPERLQALLNGSEDPGFAELYFNFGRYLLISCSRPGGLPANLQGIWAEEIQSPWNGDWHLNAQQMNYWSAEVCNLSELHEPYLKLTEALSKSGAKTAHDFYNAKGWVAHHITNPWCYTLPSERALWGSSTMGGTWLCQHLWDHYLFTGDRVYLEWAYPIMKGSAEFILDILAEDPETGWLVVLPGDSPENGYYDPEEKEITGLSIGTAYDMQIVRYLFKACIDAAGILERDDSFKEELKCRLEKLAPTRLDSKGLIMEWQREFDVPWPNHRHISHLWGAYPGVEITPDNTPDLASAAIKTIEKRGLSGSGWAVVHRQGVFARMYQAGYAYKCLEFLFKYCTYSNLFNRSYNPPENTELPKMPELSDFSLPFQIDGNLGGPGIIAEMLVQSHLRDTACGEDSGNGAGLFIIRILPALPDEWPQGHILGLRCRGGFEADIRWNDGRLANACLKSIGGKECIVKYCGKTLKLDFTVKKAWNIGDKFEIVEDL